MSWGCSAGNRLFSPHGWHESRLELQGAEDLISRTNKSPNPTSAPSEFADFDSLTGQVGLLVRFTVRIPAYPDKYPDMLSG